MAVTGIISTGLTFSLSGFSYKIRNISVGPLTRTAIQASKMDTSAWHDFLAGSLKDPGEVTLELESTGALPTFSNAASGTITFSNSASISASMFLTSCDITAQLEDIVIMNATFKVTGAWS